MTTLKVNKIDLRLTYLLMCVCVCMSLDETMVGMLMCSPQGGTNYQYLRSCSQVLSVYY